VRKSTVREPAPTDNRLLAALPAADLQRLLPHLEPVALPLGLRVYAPGDEISHALFLTDGIVSIVYMLEDGASTEISVIGNEGMVGIHLIMGGHFIPGYAVVQSAGHALRLPAMYLREEFERGGEFSRLLLRFIQALLTQMAQTTVCNRYHHIDQQLCRWLLMSLDRLPDNELHMTQELIANMLGVRREGVTEAAGRLQRDSLIRYHRGHITVLDRPGLEHQVCECYQAVKRETDRLLPGPTRTRAGHRPSPPYSTHIGQPNSGPSLNIPSSNKPSG